MSLTQLNELLKRALNELHDERATIITFRDPARALLPESYWREQLERSQDAATQKAAELFERSLNIAQAKAHRRAEDERLANLPIDELLNDPPPLWKPEPSNSMWGRLPMKHSGGVTRPPLRDDPQPSYDYECYQCSRPITDEGKDHAGRTRCDHATLDPACSGHRNHQAKPWHGEEEDDDDDW